MVRCRVKKEVLPDKFEVRDLVGVSWNTLQKLFKTLQGREITPKDLPQWKLMLGFVNATNNSVKTSMQCFKLSTLPQSINYLKKTLKRTRRS